MNDKFLVEGKSTGRFQSVEPNFCAIPRSRPPTEQQIEEALWDNESKARGLAICPNDAGTMENKMDNETLNKVIVYTDKYDGEILVFSSEKKLLDYFQSLYPGAKNLRVKRWTPTMLSVLNYNTPITDGWNQSISEVEVDADGG